MSTNGWRVMWVLAAFDCPVGTAEERHDYTVFRKLLLRQNFVQHQYSVYLKHYPTLATAEAAIRRLRGGIPAGARVAFFLLTDKQYAMTRTFVGFSACKSTPDAPQQIQLF